MDTGFHYDDIPPQNWLDELHGFNIQGVWDISLNTNQRRNLVNRANEQLKTWRIALRDQIKKIEARYDASNKDAKERMLEPYLMLDKLGEDISVKLRDLDSRLQSGRAIPQGVDFGTRIFGDLKTKRWFLGERADESRWKDFISVEKRYYSLTKEFKQQSVAYKNAAQRVKEYQQDLQALATSYKKESGFSQIGVRLLIVIITIVFCLLIGFVAFFVEFSLGASLANEAVGGIMLVLAVVAAIVAVQLARRRREAIATLQGDITEMRANLKQAKEQALYEKQYLLPTQQTHKEVKLDYQALKATF